jgi:hypothetical protein
LTRASRADATQVISEARRLDARLGPRIESGEPATANTLQARAAFALSEAASFALVAADAEDDVIVGDERVGAGAGDDQHGAGVVDGRFERLTS